MEALDKLDILDTLGMMGTPDMDIPHSLPLLLVCIQLLLLVDKLLSLAEPLYMLTEVGLLPH